MDDWDADDWEADDFQVPSLTGLKLNDKKFDDEDVEDDASSAQKTKKKAQKPNNKKKEKEKVVVDVPLDDPIAEKRRQQRLIEESDLQNAKDLFGEDLDEKIDEIVPKTEEEFEAFAKILAGKYVTPHKNSAQYKKFIKVLIKSALSELASHEVKDIESSVVAVRNERLKAEKAAAGSKSKKGNKKQQLNAGVRGGDAGLDDAQFYNNALDMDDDYDFM